MRVGTVGIIGAGTMGSGIAQVCDRAGLDVILTDMSEELVDRGRAAVAGGPDRLAARNRLSPPEKAAALAHVRISASYEALAPADVLIEAATEKPRGQAGHPRADRPFDPARRHRRLEHVLGLSITTRAASLSRPERFIGMHFFNPVPTMALVEIARGLQTSDATRDAAEALAIRLGKAPIHVRSAPGFIVNRILLPMLNEAFFVLGEGTAEPTEIDDAMRLGCNQPLGPLALADLIGLDVLLSVMQTLHARSAIRNTARPRS
jgi:3-hydroxybutyryl-CoA dehydrogenase